jgi:hypothetical protein
VQPATAGRLWERGKTRGETFAEGERKLQIPSSKLQGNLKHQIPKRSGPQTFSPELRLWERGDAETADFSVSEFQRFCSDAGWGRDKGDWILFEKRSWKSALANDSAQSATVDFAMNGYGQGDGPASHYDMTAPLPHALKPVLNK